MSFGILSFGAYIPRSRLQRKAAADANAWFSPGLKSQKGERSMAGWDEDSVTMAVDAARDALEGFSRDDLTSLQLASTSLPFEDRQNSGIAANALNLSAEVGTLDLAGSLRAGTSGLVNALRGKAGRTLLVAAEHRKTKAGSPQEMAYGDGAAALLIGEGDVVAKLVGSASESVDFVDHYRTEGSGFDYGWEERWIRDEGYMKIVPRVVGRLLEQTKTAPDSITHFCMPGTVAKISGMVAKKCGLAEASARDNLAGVCGDTGAAHALMLLVHALEESKPGDKILVANFAQGCDAMLFEVTDAIGKLAKRRGVSGSLKRRREENNYGKLLAFNDLIPLERGMRAEVDKVTPLTALYRNRDMILGLVGGKCTKCGTLQYPKSRICVSPNCNAVNSQEDHPFADMKGAVMSFTADMLTYSPEPPQHFGMIQFAEGGRIMMDFTDVDTGKVDVGMQMRMVFRIKDFDTQRGFVRYFWKASPVDAAA
jgi:3-hydroxy-3-methylglutaryl CoA synthase